MTVLHSGIIFTVWEIFRFSPKANLLFVSPAAEV